MILDIQPGIFNIKDNEDNIKFSLDRRLPKVLYNLTGILSIPTILGASPKADFIEREDEFVLINNQLITDQNYLAIPFFKINGGVADTGTKIISGIGSTIIREIRQPGTSLLLGTSILDTAVENNTLKIKVKNSFNRQGYTNITGDSDISISYRVYYARFS